MKKAVTVLLLIISISIVSVGQTVNQVNADGKKEGKYVKYYDNNKKRYEGQFRNDVPYGKFNHYYNTSELKAVVEFSDDGIIAQSISYYKNGKLMAKGKYIDEQKDGTWNYYLDEEDNPLISTEHFKNGLLSGESITYYADSGNVAELVEYKDGGKHGKLLKYFPNGVLMTESYYSNGQPDGSFLHNHPDGSVQIRGKYYKGVQTGEWEYFDEKGNPVSEEEFTKQEEVKEIK